MKLNTLSHVTKHGGNVCLHIPGMQIVSTYSVDKITNFIITAQKYIQPVVGYQGNFLPLPHRKNTGIAHWIIEVVFPHMATSLHFLKTPIYSFSATIKVIWS